MKPLLQALRALGGSGSIAEIYDTVAELQNLPEEILGQLHDPEKSTESEVAYRLAWARTYLRKYGLLENSSRGVWTLTPKARDTENVDPAEVVKFVRALDSKAGSKRKSQSKSVSADERPDAYAEWREKLHRILTMKLDAAAFERLTQRLLRESGFVQVEVTGRSGDGGIDGKGIARIHGLMSFHVLFQCKKYQGAVPANAIRDFREAMVGRADKGLFITTGTFTPAAVKEATRDGAPPIDLVNGDDFADKLKELDLGVKKELVEQVTVDDRWFERI